MLRHWWGSPARVGITKDRRVGIKNDEKMKVSARMFVR